MGLSLFENLKHRIFSPEKVLSSRLFKPEDITAKIGLLPPEIADLKDFDFIVVSRTAQPIYIALSQGARTSSEKATRVIIIDNLNPEGTKSGNTVKELAKIKSGDKCLLLQTTIGPEGKRTSGFIKAHPADWTVCSMVSQLPDRSLKGGYPVFSILKAAPEAQVQVVRRTLTPEKFIPANPSNHSVSANMEKYSPKEREESTVLSEIHITYPASLPEIFAPNPVPKVSNVDLRPTLLPALLGLNAQLPK